MCGCDCYISVKIIHSLLLLLKDRYLKKLKDQSCNVQNRRYGKMANSIFEKYLNYSMLHGKHMYKTSSDMAMKKCVHIKFQHMH